MFATISCPKCGNNPRFIFENPSFFSRSFTFCERCGGFAFAINHHSIYQHDHHNKNGYTPDIIRCLSYENLSDTAAYLNEGLSFNRDVNLLAAAYSHYRYGKSEAYKIILKNGYSSSYSFNMSLVSIFSVHKNLYFMDKNDIEILLKKTDAVCYSLIEFLARNSDFQGSNGIKTEILYTYLTYLTLLKTLDGITESVPNNVKDFFCSLNFDPYKHNHLFAERIGVYSSEWPETMASLLCRPDKPSDSKINNTTEIYQQPLSKEL